MSDQPKTATGEARWEASEAIGRLRNELDITTEKGSGLAKDIKTVCDYAERLRELLAADRESQGALPYGELEALYRAALKDLDAERSQHRMDVSEIRRQHQQEADEWTTDEELSKQLAAEREKVQPLVDALMRLNERKWYDGTGEIIQEALAKVKEGK